MFKRKNHVMSLSPSSTRGIIHLMRKLIKNISLWGDSIMKGIVFNNLRNRYETLKSTAASQCAQLLGLDIRNNARFGCTITKGARLFTQAIERGLDCDIVVIEFGGNDCDYKWAEVSANPRLPHTPNTPIKLFCQTYREMIRVIRARTIEPILLNLPPLDAQRYFDWIVRLGGLNAANILSYLGSIETIYRVQERYSLAVTRIASQLKCDYIDLREAFLAHSNYIDLLCEDGIHPNANGQAVISQAVVDYVTERRAA
jgi:lysophospholipase L1-like esterase